MEFVQYDRLVVNGDAYVQQGDYDQAVIAYRSALALMPAERDMAVNAAYAKIYIALGDVYRLQGRWYQAKNCYAVAVQNTAQDGWENIYASFGYGQALLENSDAQNAAPYLLKAYRSRRELFDGQDGKYYACIATQVEEEQAREDARRRALSKKSQEIQQSQQRPAKIEEPKETSVLPDAPEVKKGFLSSLFKRSH